MANKYVPYTEGSEESLIFKIESLVRAYGNPRKTFPKELYDFTFLGKTLDEWLLNIDCIERGVPTAFYVVSVMEELKEVLPGTYPYFFLEGVFCELICNPNKVKKEMFRQRQLE